MKAVLTLMLLIVVALLASLLLGDLRPGEVDLETLWLLRGPRALLALGVGGILAVSGVLLQALFSNPICEPYTLGISSGAALGGVLLAALGIHGVVEGIALGPLAGALGFSLPLWLLSRRAIMGSSSLLLAGVLLGFFGSSLVALVMALSPSGGVTQALVWLLGDLTRASSTGALASLGVGVVLTAWIWRRHPELDTLLLGERSARSVGVSVDALRGELLVVSALLVAWAVSLSGMIGFVGLMVPHAVRSWQGASHRKVLPLSFLMGGLALILADLAGRLLFSPREVPVGVLTALVGVPAYGAWALRGLRRA